MFLDWTRSQLRGKFAHMRHPLPGKMSLAALLGAVSAAFVPSEELLQPAEPVYVYAARPTRCRGSRD